MLNQIFALYVSFIPASDIAENVQIDATDAYETLAECKAQAASYIFAMPSASNGDMIVGVQCVPELDKREGE